MTTTWAIPLLRALHHQAMSYVDDAAIYNRDARAADDEATRQAALLRAKRAAHAAYILEHAAAHHRANLPADASDFSFHPAVLYSSAAWLAHRLGDWQTCYDLATLGLTHYDYDRAHEALAAADAKLRSISDGKHNLWWWHDGVAPICIVDVELRDGLAIVSGRKYAGSTTLEKSVSYALVARAGFERTAMLRLWRWAFGDADGTAEIDSAIAEFDHWLAWRGGGNYDSND